MIGIFVGYVVISLICTLVVYCALVVGARSDRQ